MESLSSTSELFSTCLEKKTNTNHYAFSRFSRKTPSAIYTVHLLTTSVFAANSQYWTASHHCQDFKA